MGLEPNGKNQDTPMRRSLVRERDSESERERMGGKGRRDGERRRCNTDQERH